MTDDAQLSQHRESYPPSRYPDADAALRQALIREDKPCFADMNSFLNSNAASLENEQKDATKIAAKLGPRNGD